MSGVLVVLFLFLGVVFLWVARTMIVDFWARRFGVPKETPWLPNYWHATSLGAAVIFFVLAGMLAYVFLKETKAPSELAQFVPVYPNLSGATVVPNVNADRSWLFRSEDSPGAIAAFYESLPPGSGWSVQRSGDEQGVWLELERDGTEVSLLVIQDGDQSKLMYRLKGQGSPAPGKLDN